jgi:hypothetical protein
VELPGTETGIFALFVTPENIEKIIEKSLKYK